MKKIVLLAFVLVLLSALFLTQPKVSIKASPGLISVPYDYPTIQEAINHADEGDTVFVYNGTYSEPQVTIRKPLQLIGENKRTTIIDGGGSWVCVYVQSTTNVNITGFTIQNGYGIYSYRSDNVTISENIISNNGQGIVILESTNNTVSKNIVTLNGAMPISLSGSSDNKICENIVTLNSGDGIWLDNSHGNIISRNNVSNNGLGTATGYHVYGIRLSYSKNNTIYHNYVIDNYEQASGWSSVNNTWDNGYPSGGNYWSDYNGRDLFSGPYQNETGSDEIGDIPHVINADNQDRYPLMSPFTEFNVTCEGQTFYVNAISNSTISDFYFSRDDKLISFNVNGTDGTVGFCRVTVPKTLMWCDALAEWNVIVGGVSPAYLKALEDANYTYLYFTYSHTTHNVKITSTYVIEEVHLPSPFWMQWWFWAIVIAVIASLAVDVYFLKKRKPLTPTAPQLPTEGTPQNIHHAYSCHSHL